jgi:hypothetical protein
MNQVGKRKCFLTFFIYSIEKFIIFDILRYYTIHFKPWRFF